MENDSSYFRPSMAWARWVAKLSGIPGSGSAGPTDGLSFRHPESSITKKAAIKHIEPRIAPMTRIVGVVFTIVTSKTPELSLRRVGRHLADSFGAHRRRIRDRHKRRQRRCSPSSLRA